MTDLTASRKCSNFTLLLALFVLLNLIVVVVKPIYVDPGIYWLYSHHLAWVYYDSPPLVTYVTGAATTLFGTHFWVINALSLIFILASARYLYRLAKHNYGKTRAELITLVWLFTPGITHIYFRWNWTYNNLLSFLWIMTLYYFYQAQKTKKTRYFYLSAIGLGLAVLTNFSAFFLILTLLATLIFVPSYRKMLSNKHSYWALFLSLIIVSPYVYALVQTHWQAVVVQFQFHADARPIFFNLASVVDYFNDIINEIDLFFVIGIIYVVIKYKQIKQNDVLQFFLYSAVIISVPFLILSLHTGTPIRFYMPFYYGFILLSIPLISGRGIRYLRWILWANILLFALDTWNTVVPRYGISPGTNIFHQNNIKDFAEQMRPQIKSSDLLLGCAHEVTSYDNISDYTNLATLAFYLNHSNTYSAVPGFFAWQPAVEQVFAQNKGATVFYFCSDAPPKSLTNLVCAPVQTISSVSYRVNNPIEDKWYVQKCKIVG
jgi:hypothetical protein